MYIAYLDLLGFSYFVESDLEGANRLLSSYLQIFNFRNQPYYRNESRGGIFTIDSIQDFIPFSDSVVITSEDINSFLPQLSRFLLDSFLYHGKSMRFPERAESPHETTVSNVEIENAQIVTTQSLQNWYPVLFRGGISSGEVNRGIVPSIYNASNYEYPIFTGMPVVQAVRLEQSGHQGPRILINSGVISDINDNASLLVGPQFDMNNEHTELYWPAIIFYNTEDYESNLKNEFAELFDISIVLWKAYRINSRIERQYFNFMRLIYKSGKSIFERNNWDMEMFRETVNTCFRVAELTEVSGLLD
ncbi:hypothetical protein EHO59_18105 [Leptospira semungkisensis]|uniref:Uncharacterized protein n=1 Tax=Leptospira semungkisensis TaxID=2484985 RepID=A0A4R9FJU1_9LEPT|nr:hypothetical protein [Leptospira semungkisensis]TGJ98680.1 hypothetical protein EHO59_18105 [Leptospira semungkisensis]